MNWLAHVLLSEPDIEFRLGNLLADVVRGDARTALGEKFVQGTQRHRFIDAFTDNHPVVRRSRARLSPAHRRFSGVIMDVYYDYELATQWPTYCATPLAAFTHEFYCAIRGCALQLPADATLMLERIMKHDLLGSYLELAGVERSLRRISMGLKARWNREFALEDAIPELLEQREALGGDFAEFFPELQRAAANQREA